MAHNSSLTGVVCSDIQYIGITPAAKHCLLVDAESGRRVHIERPACVESHRVLAIPSGSAGLGIQKPPALVAALSSRDREETQHHRKVYRPWGSFDSVDQGEGFQVKRITVDPGKKLSLQRHQHRAEHWIVVRGRGEVTVANDTFVLEEDQSTYIPIGAVHRLANVFEEPLEIIEVQTGAYLGEDAIERLEDDFHRSSSD